MQYEMSELRGPMGYHEFVQYVTSCELDDFEDVMADIYMTLVFIDGNRAGRFTMSDVFALLGRMNPVHFRGRVKIWEEIYEAFRLMFTLEEDFKKGFTATQYSGPHSEAHPEAAQIREFIKERQGRS